MRKEIVDNETDRYSMANFLRENLPATSKLDIASGFFNVSGFAKIREELWATSKQPNFSMRLLFGRETEINETHENMNCEGKDPTIKDELSSLDITEKTAHLIDNLIDFPQAGYSTGKKEPKAIQPCEMLHF